MRTLPSDIVEQVASLACVIAAIPAPTFEEAERARFVAEWLSDRGAEVTVDEVSNVVVRWRGRGHAKSLLLAAHLDTVFPRETPLTFERGDGWIRGPGIGDNALGVAALLTLWEFLAASGLELPGDVILAANVGEEGLGNLRGMRALIDRYGPELGAVIAVEGHNLGRVTHVAVGSIRIRIVVRGPGGHSWGNFGTPSAIHELARIVSALTELEVPRVPKTTYNVGTIAGGVSVNTIAPVAQAVVDLRSIDRRELERLYRAVEAICVRHRCGSIAVDIELLGERPAGETPADSILVQQAVRILRKLGIEPILDASSTDANAAIGAGIPAICIGLTRGRGSHTLEETIELPPLERGLLQLIRLVESFPVS
ncbi:M20/M25/M40 family metallo-hydrolase [Thermomicrobium sp. 4228-Ro]|uniref:M20/M25/M40 family metallo-hydrolase n=1 Tax=Thermomicrobium sp. 4228-Ro TaxID=2993937 RepID=UPI002248FC9A|nr:M20/M25/M40 family metallo-hydrolase [Thermomicrobium sp. 4228-Ro]MCX2726521.1 M20/M25/M40 family metallo-hydrolase [Thermomicrobium sp. 4228-Ro]